MKLAALSLVPFLIVIAGCKVPAAPASEIPPQSIGTAALVLPGDEEILATAYDRDYSVPVGFYRDPRAETTRSYTLHHVLDASDSFEICSDDLVEAQALEEQDNANRAVGGYYVASVENERYYEFIRELSFAQQVGNVADLTSPGYARIFKCSHTNRSGVDRTLLDGYAGRLNVAPLSGDVLRDFVEYFWQFTYFDAAQKKVIDSFSSTADGVLEHTLVLAFVISQGTGRCDRIELSRWRFTADLESGEIEREFDLLRSFEADLSDGIPHICP